jgi:hypothetical protein
MKIFILILFLNYSSSWRFFPVRKHLKVTPKKKKFISISPAGFYGFYTLGISSFLKNNYNLNNYYYIGASSGSWSSLFSCYKYNNLIFINDLLQQEFLKNPKSIHLLQQDMSNYILQKYTTNDFNLDKLYISLTEFNKFKFSNKIISNFTSLNDALNCCISSSHIPFITSNKIANIYRGKFVFDGGFSSFPPDSIKDSFIIYSDLFNYSDVNSAFLGIITKNISSDIGCNLFKKGYSDSKKNKNFLDKYFDNGDYLFYMDYL